MKKNEIKNYKIERDTGKEILETMSYDEAKEFLTPIFEEKIKKKSAFEKKYKQILRITKKYHAPGTVEYDFCVDAIWIMQGLNDDQRNQSELNEIESYYRLNESRKPKTTKILPSTKQDNTLLIQTAKYTPIENYYINPLKKSGINRLVGVCPFHQEKHGSFTIYTNTNTFYCFGCHEKGDIITFYQKLYGVSFWEAVKQLTGSY